MIRTVVSQLVATVRRRRRRHPPGRGRCVCTGLLVTGFLVAGLTALPAAAQTGISDEGITFPDGSVQTTADPCANPEDDSSDVMIEVGGVCIDKYEASIWTARVGGTQIMANDPIDYCDPDGHDCEDIYARSVPDVEPAAHITWFQAQQALANSGKRLPTSAEWQMAVAGTPDDDFTEDGCDVTGDEQPTPTGQRANCVSVWDAFDMVGNLSEWVADWVPFPNSICGTWGDFSDDFMCLAGTDTTFEGPGALLRGGAFISLIDAGPFAVEVDVPYNSKRQDSSNATYGFRGAR